MYYKLITFEKSVGAVVFRIREDGEKEFLLLQYRSGQWDFARGHVENNESEEETLRREIREETGIIDPQILPGFREKVWIFYRAKREEREKRIASGRGVNIIKQIVIYLVKTEYKNVDLSFENINYIWLPKDEALEKITFSKAKKVFKKAQNFLA